MTALFQSGFIPSLNPEEIRSAWKEKGKDVLLKVNKDWLNRYSDLNIVSQSESNDPDNLFGRASNYEDKMVQNLLNASKTTRHERQKKLIIIDLRGVSELEVNKTYKQKTEKID